MAIVAKRWMFFRPWIDSFWSLVAIVMPLVAEIGGRILASKGESKLASRLVAPNLSAYCTGKIAQNRL